MALIQLVIADIFANFCSIFYNPLSFAWLF